MKISEMSVEYLDHMGTDLDVVNAARVSFAKESKELEGKDEKLIKYLALHNHWSPFAHCIVKFRIKAPIFVARQAVKHQVGLSWNEESRRYVDYEPEFYWPKEWRKRAANIKQGSGGETVDYRQLPRVALYSYSKDEVTLYDISNVIEALGKTYEQATNDGIAPEMARMWLPQNVMTNWIWTGSLYAWARICNLRIQPDAQKEIRELAEKISQEMLKLYPISWTYLALGNTFSFA